MAKFDSSKKHDFNLDEVLKSFQLCLSSENSLDLKEYLSAFHELCRFFKLTGKLFGFVAKDLESKIRAIEYHMDSINGEHYRTVQSMMAHEIANRTTHVKQPHASGTRMLLRLHHALEFILAFMRRIMQGDEHEKMSKLAWEVYKETLYHHHPNITHLVAAIAVYALPTKKHLIDVMCKHDFDKVMGLLGPVVDAGQPVYDCIQELFSSNNLLHIP
ncbi:ceramide-1-phosphate transfer protein-like [Physella acuta]|uniref:ceramide-1-phosphate transfer protein-like n=1 Tax=Physella acuta TaxID=109671 RepID=UPI0027DB82A3|nr:ceramide-1-phosphate transfer protein-like [Physella acuta]XP_059172257.1 ceramide-1-phosphate transfer protein-like [Physella acuta]XP_059172258.1 ceramide-1-phosphate transfer protein-like [Physella acuta]XP_059172259.1 ceramide-1-phosphate transfer protein-like [Physella acuta]